jgi:hypothetical protein
LHLRAKGGVTIALMAKFKPAKGKGKAKPLPHGGLPCVIVMIAGIFLLMFFLYWVMKNNAGG